MSSVEDEYSGEEESEENFPVEDSWSDNERSLHNSSAILARVVMPTGKDTKPKARLLTANEKQIKWAVKSLRGEEKTHRGVLQISRLCQFYIYLESS